MTKSPFLPVIAILGAVLIGLFALKSYVSTHPETPGSQRSATATGSILTEDFLLHPMGSKPIPFSALGKRVTLINFWATWCDACIEEMPSIQKLKSEFSDQGFDVVAISVDENPEAVVPKFLSKMNLNFGIYTDPEHKLADLFDVSAIPLTVILDRSRKILLAHAGERNWASNDIREKMKNWLATAP